MIEGVDMMLCVPMHWENQLNISSCMSVYACDWVCVYLLIEIGLTGWEGTDVSMCLLPARLNKANRIVSLSKSTKTRDLQNHGLILAVNKTYNSTHVCSHIKKIASKLFHLPRMDLEMQSIGIVRETKLTARRICYCSPCCYLLGSTPVWPHD